MQRPSAVEAAALWRNGRKTEALRMFEEMGAQTPNDPRPHAMLGELAHQSSDFALAQHAFEEAVARDPNSAHWRLALARTLATLGRFEKAEEEFNASLRLEPEAFVSYLLLSHIHVATPGDPLIDRLEKFKQSPGRTIADLGYIEFALAKFYDDIGEWDRAFENLKSANSRVPVVYDHAAALSDFQQIKLRYSRDEIAAAKDLGEPSDKPVFIVGMPRSGTTLAEAMLAQFEGVAALGERPDLTYVEDDIIASDQKGEPRQPLAYYGARYLEGVCALAQDASRTIDKNTLNFRRVGLLRMILPNARVIHTRRNAVDVCLSCFFQTLSPHAFPYSFDLADLGAYYRLYHDLMRYWDEVAPNICAHVDYETLVNQSDNGEYMLFDLLGLGDAPRKKTSGQSGPIHTSSAWQARQPVYESSVGRWRRYEKHLGPLLDALGELAG
ncbi:MAG: tetratricopeptide repeat protein [Alphaproteobacteria bacterium]|nr:tetratricopeptide repeat protein [Alphaproteobacteria bacterium]